MDALCILIGSFIHIPRCTVPTSSPDIFTTFGPIEGNGFPGVDGSTVRAFRGIPYGKVDHRGILASPPEEWTNVLKTMREAPPCPEGTNTATDEDCLKLNFFIPSVKRNGSFPVLFFILSEEFIPAVPSSPSASVILASTFVPQGIAVVTVQYRVGPLGFLKTENDDNMGLTDLLLALQFVSSNAEAFGADATKISVAGVGNGAQLASALAISPQTKGLINSLLLFSGSSWSLGGNMDNSEEYFRRLNCDNRTTRIECFQKASLETVEAAAAGLTFSPTIGSSMLPYEPSVLLLSAAQMPTLFTFSPEVPTLLTRNDFEQYIADISLRAGRKAFTVVRRITEFYIPLEEDLLDDQYAKLKKDVDFRIPAIREAMDRSAFSSVYVAELENSDEVTLLLENGQIQDKTIFLQSVTNFLITRNPSTASVTWPLFDKEATHLEISNKTEKDTNMLDDELEFWDALAREIGSDFFSGRIVGPEASASFCFSYVFGIMALALLF